MSHHIDRREFLTLAAAGVSLPKLWDLAESDTQGLAAVPGGTASQAGLLDYRAHPVTVVNPALPGASAQLAFDGYGGSLQPNAVAHVWAQEGKPSEAKPFFCTVDYGTPVTVTKFVHYFFVPAVKDYRTEALLLSTAWESVNIYRSEDGTAWTPAEQVKDLPPDWPQVVTLSEPRPSRYFKLEITGLVAGAEGVRTYEIETFTGPAIHDPHPESSEVKLGEVSNLQGRVVGAEEQEALTVSVASSEEVELAGGAASIEKDGNFKLAVRPLRAGTIPILVELKDKSQALLDQRKLYLRVAPRVEISAVKMEGETLTGRLSNTATVPIAVRLESGSGARLQKKLAPGAAADFRLKGVGQGAGMHIVELKVWEGNRSSSQWAFAVEGTGAAKEGAFQNEQVKVEWSTEAEELRFRLTPQGANQALKAALQTTFDDAPVSFSTSQIHSDKVTLSARHRDGLLECTLQLTGASVAAKFRSVPEGVQYATTPGVIGLRLKTEAVKFRFVPAYVYSDKPLSSLTGLYGKEPLSTVRSGCAPPTRMAALETEAGTLALVPNRDRCLLGIDHDDAVVKIRAEEPPEVLIAAVTGDWFESFRYVVENIYEFTEPRQFKPLIQAVSGEAHYLTHNQDIWNQKMQVLTSFPNRDYVFVFYGLTYTVPALYSWYQMSGDEQALDRARKCVRWLLEFPGERVEDGPAAGAFFSQYGLPGAENCCGGGEVSLGGLVNGGGDAGNHPWLEPHATGAAAWILLYHYVADGKKDDKALAAAKAGLDWLLKIQNPGGGWKYAYRVDGTPSTEVEGAGNIWSIWALYRYGKLTGEQKYLEAAERGKRWFAAKYIAQHICNGYWEDTAGGYGGAVAGTSWEAYEFGVAANVFAEMGDKELALEAAKNAVTWVWTRVIDCRDYFNSYGHAHEQYFWPPATYVAPMYGLAAQTAYWLSGDELFQRFAGAAKTIGWWTVRETEHGIYPPECSRAELGAGFWPTEAPEFVSLEGPLTPTYWVDWITAQQTAICLRWLVNEVNHRSGGKVSVDADTLTGTIMGAAGKISLRPDDVSVEASHNQINWLGYRTAESHVLAVINHDVKTTVKTKFPALAASRATVMTSADGQSWQEKSNVTGSSIDVELPARGCTLIAWDLKSK